MNYEGIKFIFDNYPNADKVLIAPDGEIFLANNLHGAKDHCTRNNLQWSAIREYTRTAFNQDYRPEPENTTEQTLETPPADPNTQKPITKSTTEKTAKK
jgi:hypothetical protein